MNETTTTPTYSPGDLVRKHWDRHDPMAYYVFKHWADVPAHVRGGRIAQLVWCFNGTPSCAWEADLVPTTLDRSVVHAAIVAEHAKNAANRAVAVVS